MGWSRFPEGPVVRYTHGYGGHISTESEPVSQSGMVWCISETTLTVLLHSYLLPFESLAGGLIGLQVPPVSQSQGGFEIE